MYFIVSNLNEVRFNHLAEGGDERGWAGPRKKKKYIQNILLGKTNTNERATEGNSDIK
jgi:hypothetical protein